jgi:probable HAF family extracellular repeat protein
MHSRSSRPSRRRKLGLTLSELLVAITALGLLGSYFLQATPVSRVRSGRGATANPCPERITATVTPKTPLAAVYSIQDLGTLGGDRSAANAINNRGQVVGTAYTADGAHHAFLWQEGRMRDLGTLGGKYSQAVAINNRGQVLGQADTRHGVSHAFLWMNNRMRDLGDLGACGINDRDEVAGTADLANGQGHAFVFRNGKMRRLKSLSGYSSEAYGINNRGQIAGTSKVHDGTFQHAFVYDHGRVTDLNKIGTGWFGASACAINDRGQVLGGITAALPPTAACASAVLP